VKILGVLLLLVLLAVGAGAFLLYTPVTPPGETFVDLPVGTGSEAMAVKLEAAHVLRSRYAFLLLRIVKGGTLKAGEYRFVDAASAETVYSRIARGDVATVDVVIPPGFNLFDIANAIEKAGLAPKDDFLQAAHTNLDLIRTWAPAATSLEGYLYPDTYKFSHHSTPRSMQEAMVHRFRKELLALDIADTQEIGQKVILASLVEKEVHFDNERTEAAGVFINRLNRNMPLQTDPTVIYAAMLANRWTGAIHRSDLDFDSPYNTYKHGGLPPGPICSPGAAALKAALHPAATDSLYFVADNTGHTNFATSLSEHNANVAAYRQGLQNSLPAPPLAGNILPSTDAGIPQPPTPPLARARHPAAKSVAKGHTTHPAARSAHRY